MDVVAAVKTSSDEHHVQLITEQLPLTAWLTKMDNDVKPTVKLNFGISLRSSRSISLASLFTEYRHSAWLIHLFFVDKEPGISQTTVYMQITTKTKLPFTCPTTPPKFTFVKRLN